MKIYFGRSAAWPGYRLCASRRRLEHSSGADLPDSIGSKPRNNLKQLLGGLRDFRCFGISACTDLSDLIRSKSRNNFSVNSRVLAVHRPHVGACTRQAACEASLPQRLDVSVNETECGLRPAAVPQGHGVPYSGNLIADALIYQYAL